ncbi:MAG: aldo/keto reductase, partial [Candidatus Latescibacteria bacterium]|nr:aldo/keto reductase [Candidatus Latescibacterota bacterium]
QFVDEEDDYERVMGSGGLLELARRFRLEGKAGFIGLSGHSVPVALKAVKSGHIDVLMFPINLRSDAVLEEKELFNVCASRGVGLVAMKPFAGGKLFQKEEARSITSVQCISYALSQIGVSTVVPGVKDLDELEAALHFLDATDEEKDFSSILPEFQQYVKGECVYCNHCLPCPAVIDIGQTIRLVDTAQHGVSEDLRADYQALSVKASACIECGSCTTRCPFEVDVISKMQRAVKLFEINASA